MMKISKTVLYKSKMLMSFFLATMIIVVSIPVVVSDPPEIEDTLGPVSPESVDPTTPGFRYDPEEDMTITGYASDMSQCHSDRDGDCDDWWDEDYFGGSLNLSEYGPNVLSGTSDFLSTLCSGCDDYGNCCSASGNLQIGYTGTGSIREIVLSTGSLVTSGLSVTSTTKLVGADNSGTCDSMSVSIPFIVNEHGRLFVRESIMSLEPLKGGTGTWTYDIRGGGSWYISGLSGADDDFEVYDRPGHHKLEDQWNEDRYIELPTGDYEFIASFHMSQSASCGANPETESASANVMSRIMLSIKLLYLPAG